MGRQRHLDAASCWVPEPSGNPADLVPWLHSLTASVLPGLLKQADPQHVIEYSLALITVLNEVSAYGLKRILHMCSMIGVKPVKFPNVLECQVLPSALTKVTVPTVLS